MTTSTPIPHQTFLSLPHIPYLSDLSFSQKVYSFGHTCGLTLHNFLSTSHQINTLRNIYSTLKTTTYEDLLTILPSYVETYKQWWLDLVREDPVHVLIETLLVSFLLYLVLIRKKEHYRKKMQDRLTEKEIEGLLREWKERGRVTLTGVPIEEWELKKKKKMKGVDIDAENDNGASEDEKQDGGSTGSFGGLLSGGGRKKRSWNMNQVIIESMHGSKLVVRIDNGNHGKDNTTNSGGAGSKKDKNAIKTMTALNFATFDFLGMSCPETNNKDDSNSTTPTRDNQKKTKAGLIKNNTNTVIPDVTGDVVKEASIKALTKYGCGSCGPRGFYGTIDAHLDLENAITDFLQTDGAILYSDGAAASASTVAAFAKRGDLLVVDEGIYEALGTGVILSRANVKYFKHNDMDDLRNVLERIQATDESLNRKKNDQRRFIVVEALYKNYGTICPLDELIKLKEEFCYRLILDESFSFGSLGETGKGALEHFGLNHMRHAEIVTFSLENSMGSIGGITVGNEEVVDHQRLSGAGYCFSASLPPFLATAAQASLKKMDSEPQLLGVLRENITYAYEQLTTQLANVIPSKIVITSEEAISPIVYLQFAPSKDKAMSREEQIDLFDKVACDCLENGLFIVSTGSHVNEHLHKVPPPAIRITIQAKHRKAEIETAVKVLKKVIGAALSG